MSKACHLLKFPHSVPDLKKMHLGDKLYQKAHPLQKNLFTRKQADKVLCLLFPLSFHFSSFFLSCFRAFFSLFRLIFRHSASRHAPEDNSSFGASWKSIIAHQQRKMKPVQPRLGKIEVPGNHVLFRSLYHSLNKVYLNKMRNWGGVNPTHPSGILLPEDVWMSLNKVEINPSMSHNKIRMSFIESLNPVLIQRNLFIWNTALVNWDTNFVGTISEPPNRFYMLM